MKTILKITLAVCGFFSLSAFAQTQDPDQNPNYQTSQDKYIAKSDELLQNQGETIQDTYKAYDWTENKAEEKQARQDRRYELKKMRYQYRRTCNPRPYYGHNTYNSPYGYNYNGYNNGYYNNNFNPYGNQNQFNSNPTNFFSGMLLGAGLYYLFN